MAQLTVGLVIPVLNPAPYAQKIIDGIARQTYPLARVLILDSESTDGSVALFKDAGYEVRTVERATFDHGATRNLGVELLDDVDIVLFMTQDALFEDGDGGAIARLIRAFQNEDVAIAFGRQLPRLNAGAIERHARLFNYPGETIVKRLSDAGRYGVKLAFNSNSFAAYKRAVLRAVGGFPDRTVMGEDQYAAGKVLLAGWAVTYVGDAAVRHSHAYTISQDFSRNFDMGAFHAQFPFLVESFGEASGEGFRFVTSELGYLFAHAPHRIPSALMRTAAKFAGYALGRREQSLPLVFKQAVTLQKQYFATVAGPTVAPARGSR